MDSHFSNNRQEIVFSPIVDSEYKYEFEDSDEVIQEIGKSENKTRLITRNKVIFLYKILQKSTKGYAVSVNFLACEIENMSAATGLPESDSTYFRKSINSLKGTKFKIYLALDGKAEDFTGYEEYLVKNSTLKENPYSENYFLEIFDRISQLLPNYNVFAESSRKQQGIPNNRVEYLPGDYVVEKNGSGLDLIRYSSEVKQQCLVKDTMLVMRGIENGEIEIEDNSGMPMNSSKIMKLKGTCKIGEVGVVQTLVRTRTVFGKKIN
jgi:hypothetical protein